MSLIPRPQEIYRHFKGELYQIVAVAEHTETGEQLVIYRALYGTDKTYARPLEMFVSRVDRSKYPEADQEFRFALQGPDSGRQQRESQPEQTPAKREPETGTGAEQTPAKREPETGTGTVRMPAKRAPGTVAEREPEQTPAKPQAVPAETGGAAEGEASLDPLLVEFLDADTYEQRLNILAAAHPRITQDMITTMAISCDLEINDGELEERYETLKRCLITMERYECNRLR